MKSSLEYSFENAIPTLAAIRKTLSADECRSVLARTCFGHLAFVRKRHVDTAPIRFAASEGWIFFRADAATRAAIGHNVWVALSVTDVLEPTYLASVVARGACYLAQHTGSAKGDAAAMRGVEQLRDQTPLAPSGLGRPEHALFIYRLHVDELRGHTVFVPRTEECTG